MRNVSNPDSPRLHKYATENKYQRKKVITKHWCGNKPKGFIYDGMKMWIDSEYWHGSIIRIKSYGLKSGWRSCCSANPLIPSGFIVLHTDCNHSKQSRIYKKMKGAYKETKGPHNQMSFYRLYHNQYA